jgi:shikimate dehydrogenase
VLSGATRLYPIVGDPVTYAESPARLSRTFEELDHDGICVPMRVTTDEFDVVMKGLSATANVDGILVTMPHKFAAFSHCATASELSRTLGAVSVIRRNPDLTWHGDMLDGIAFVTAQRDRGASIEGARALLVGAGGAGRAIALALLSSGVGALIVHDVDETRVAEALDLAADLGGHRVRAGEPDVRGCDLVFNATSMGMRDDDPLPLNVECLTSSMFVGDVIAGHGVTRLIAGARSVGCNTANGDDMVNAVQDLMAKFLIGRQEGRPFDRIPEALDVGTGAP